MYTLNLELFFFKHSFLENVDTTFHPSNLSLYCDNNFFIYNFVYKKNSIIKKNLKKSVFIAMIILL